MANKFEGSDVSEETLKWLNDRHRNGNWIEIAPKEDIPSDIVGWDRTILHMFQISFGPEIARRREAGQIDDDFSLFAAQMIQTGETVKEVRLNEEVNGVTVIKANRPVNKGEQVYLSDLQELVSFDLVESELDYGHFTIFWTGKGWSGAFDFRTGRARSVQLVNSARQFFEAAKSSAENELPRPSVDNLFSACELIAKAELILDPIHKTKIESHGGVHTGINLRRKQGNTDSEFVSLFNKLANQRRPARYDASADSQAPTRDDFQIVERHIAMIEKSVVQRNNDSDI
ncbi:MAG: hypothetical protein ACTS1X_14415 [Parasphingopyxis sp.]|uniref:hypothetical protein n=1 Tax=Parasphingopyxis sp. TaxID=1920299 RepID=UPI003F9F100A